MNFTGIIASYFLTALVFFAIDLVWLGLIAKKIYATHLGHYLSEDVNWLAAIVFYLLYIAGIMVFAVYPAIEKDSVVQALWLGAFLGLVAYATYDLTNYATLKNWPVTIVFIDLIWGTLLTAAVSVSGFYIVKFVKGF